jgi:hypothetical protein
MAQVPGAPPPGPPRDPDVVAAASTVRAEAASVRDAQRDELVIVVRKERVAELLRNIGELWLTFGALDALFEYVVKYSYVPGWWWWMIGTIGVVLMLLGTVAGDEDAAEALLNERERR